MPDHAVEAVRGVQMESSKSETINFPPGTAYVEQVGWEEDEEHGRRFVARLVFPTGAPELTAGVVWKRRPVRIEVQNGDDETTSS
jgi:hypothetical protein